MKYLLLGGNGFIGRHLSEYLRIKGEYVRIYDQKINFRTDDKKIEYIIGKLSDTAALIEALEGIDIVYHLISTTIPSTSNLDYIYDITTNLIDTVKFLELMTKAGKKRLIFLSSGGTVYGNPQISPTPETCMLNPISSYGIVKASIEAYLNLYAHQSLIDPLILRVANPYGPNQGHSRLQGFISTALQNCLAGQPITIWGDGNIIRDYIYIDDLVEIMFTSALTNKVGTYNIGSGIGTTLNQIVDIIKKEIDNKVVVRYENNRNFDVAKIILDISKAKSDLLFSPKVSIMEGIKKSYIFRL